MDKRQETRNYVRPETHVFLMQSRRHLMDFVSFGGTGDFDVKQEADDPGWDIWNTGTMERKARPSGTENPRMYFK